MSVESRAFEARFDGGCLACSERIYAGDQVRYVDDQLIHADCDILDDHMRPIPAACPKCFMVPATNGVCECES